MSQNNRAIWFAIALLASAFVGASCGVLSWLGGLNVANAVLAGGSAFGVTLVMMVSIIQYFQ